MNKSGALLLSFLLDSLAPCRKRGEVTLLPRCPLEESMRAASLVTIDFNPPAVGGFTDGYRTLSVSLARRRPFCLCVGNLRPF